MWDLSYTHTHHAINQIGISQSSSLKSLTSSLEPTLWGSVSEPTRDQRAGSDTICNDPRKSASHICVISQKDQSQLRLLVVVNKAQIYPVNTRCGTHHTPTHIKQSIKLGFHIFNHYHLLNKHYIQQIRKSSRMINHLFKSTKDYSSSKLTHTHQLAQANRTNSSYSCSELQQIHQFIQMSLANKLTNLVCSIKK